VTHYFDIESYVPITICLIIACTSVEVANAESIDIGSIFAFFFCYNFCRISSFLFLNIQAERRVQKGSDEIKITTRIKPSFIAAISLQAVSELTRCAFHAWIDLNERNKGQRTATFCCILPVEKS
jgi:hypothetical protein